MCDMAALEAACGHIERLRDVFPLTLTPSGDTSAAGPWRCPVDRDVSTNGQHHFCALRPCGHVVRERVALELSKAAGAKSSAPSDGISSIEGAAYGCPVCAAPVEVRVRLLAAAAETEKVRETLRAERDARHAKKAERKRKRSGDAGGSSSAAAAGAAASGSASPGGS